MAELKPCRKCGSVPEVKEKIFASGPYKGCAIISIFCPSEKPAHMDIACQAEGREKTLEYVSARWNEKEGSE